MSVFMETPLDMLAPAAWANLQCLPEHYHIDLEISPSGLW